MVSDNTRSTSKKHAVARILLAITGILLAALIVLASWLFGTESGARAAFSALTSVSGGMLRADGVHGKLGSPLRLDKLTLQQPNRRITLSNLKLAWHPLALTHSTLDIDSLSVAHIGIVINSTPQASPSTLALPGNIGLPLGLHVDHAQIDSSEIERDGTKLLRAGPLAFALDFNGDRYRLRLQQLNAESLLPSGSVTTSLSGDAMLSAHKPYPLRASFKSRTKATLGQQTIASDGRIGLSGSLADLGLTPDLTINKATLSGHATLHPFSGPLLGAAQLQAHNIDLAQFDKTLPLTALDLSLNSAADGSGELHLTNRAAGPYNVHKLPIDTLTLAFLRHTDGIDFRQIDASLGSVRQPGGKLQGNGSYRNKALTLALHVEGVDLKRLDSDARTTSLSGDIDLRHATGKQELTVALSEPLHSRHITLDAHGVLENSALTLDRLALQAGAGHLDAKAKLALNGDRSFSAQGRFNHFRLRELGTFPRLPNLDLNGGFSLQGARQPQLQLALSFDIHDSLLAGRPLAGGGSLQLHGERLLVRKLLLTSGVNRLTVNGQLAPSKAQLSFELNAPQLAQLGPSFGGAFNVHGVVRGSVTQPRIRAEWHADHAHFPRQLQIEAMQGKAELDINRNQPFALQSAAADITAHGLRLGADQVASATLKLHFAPQPNAPLSLQFQAKNIAAGRLQAEQMHIAMHGTPARHDLSVALDEAGQSWKLDAQGGVTNLKNAPHWQGSITRFDASGRFDAHLAAPAALALSAQKVRLDGFVLDADSGRIAVEQFMLDAGKITSRGHIDRLQLAQVLRHLPTAPPVRTDLQLSGEWDMQLGKTLQGKFRLQRDSGDLTVLGSSPVTLGLRTLRASASAAGGRTSLQLQLDGKQLGQLSVNAATRIDKQTGDLTFAPDVPLSGSVHIDMPSLAWIGPLAPQGMVTGGKLQGDLALGGSIGTPTLAGHIDGSGLRLTLPRLGLDLREGMLQGEFQGERLLLRNLSFQSAQGRLALTGPIGLHGGAVAAQLTLSADHYQLLNRVDRRIVLSGNSQIVMQDRHARATGAFTINSGYIDIGQADKPQLSDDVVIVGAPPKEAPTLGLALDMTVGLGDGVKLTGRGLDGLLTGKIRLINDAGEPLQAYGTLSIAKGTFSAYGRELKIEQGEVRFNGPLDTPSLNILAMRRGQDVEAGVSVRGSVLAPRITLVSEPEVPDAEKLSWLVLGRSLASAGTADAGALQAAAGSLLSEGAAAGVQSRIASALGLDTLSVGTSQDSLQQRIVTLGKQISSRLYLSYQQGLQSANNVVQLRYLLTPKLSLEAEAGARSALSLFYNITFD